MTTIEDELMKILNNQCPVQNLKNTLEKMEKKDINSDILLESIGILKMHEGEIRRLRQKIELMQQSKVLERFVASKKNR